MYIYIYVRASIVSLIEDRKTNFFRSPNHIPFVWWCAGFRFPAFWMPGFPSLFTSYSPLTVTACSVRSLLSSNRMKTHFYNTWKEMKFCSKKKPHHIYKKSLYLFHSRQDPMTMSSALPTSGVPQELSFLTCHEDSCHKLTNK